MSDLSKSERELVQDIIDWRNVFVNSGNNWESKQMAQKIGEAFEERFHKQGADIPYHSAKAARDFYHVAGNGKAQVRMEKEIARYGITHSKTYEVETKGMMERGDLPEAAACVAVWPKQYTGGWSFIQGDLKARGFKNASLEEKSELNTQFANAHDNIVSELEAPQQVAQLNITLSSMQA